MKTEQKNFDHYWKPVEGMEDIQSLMVEFADTAADTLVEQVRQGNRMLIASFTNGGMNPLFYTFAELRKRYFEGSIDEETFQAIADHTVLFETQFVGKGDKKQKEVISTTEYLDKRSNGDETWQEPDMILMIDDIVEGSSTRLALEKEFPDIPKTFVVPIIKHVTHESMKGCPHKLIFTRELANDWDDSGCGMNGGIFFKDLSLDDNYEVEVLQRYSNIGYYHDPADNAEIGTSCGAMHRDRISMEQLPWMHLQPMHGDLARLEELKNYRETQQQLAHAEALLDRAKNFTYDEALSILTASY